MPTVTISYTTGELFTAALDAAREMSTRILKLVDLNATPLVPGETPDARRHQIAKLGKMLAEAFIAIDNLVAAHNAAHDQPSDVTAGVPDAPVDPNSN